MPRFNQSRSILCTLWLTIITWLGTATLGPATSAPATSAPAQPPQTSKTKTKTNKSANRTKPAGQDARQAKPQPRHPLLGIWEQRLQYEGRWKSGGLFEVATKNKSLQMNYVVRPLDPTLIISKGISGIQVNDQNWRFKSDWGTHGIGDFSLNRVAADRYEGWSSQDGKPLSANQWVRIAEFRKAQVYAGLGNYVTLYEGTGHFYLSHTFTVKRHGFVASTSVRYERDRIRLKCILVEPAAGTGERNITGYWKIAKQTLAKKQSEFKAEYGADAELEYFLDESKLSLTREQMHNMVRLLGHALNGDIGG